MPTPKFTTEILEAAITGFEQQRATIDAKITELKAMMSDSATATVNPATVSPSKKMSAAARKRIGDAVRKTAAAKRADASPGQSTAIKAKNSKRKISPEGRKRISEASKRRWALQKTAKAK